MQIVVIGTGNVANVLGNKFRNAGHEILQVFGRNKISAIELTNELNAGYCNDWKDINKNAELYLIAISDNGIADVVEKLNGVNGMIVHTAGSVTKEILNRSGSTYGVLYPLQTLRKEKLDYEQLPLLIDANNSDTIKRLEQFARTISTDVHIANDDERLKLHTAAVIASNFTNCLYDLVFDFCQKESISFDLLLPIIRETATRLNIYSPENVQTGPAIRGDLATIDKHLALLSDYPSLKEVYILMTKIIQHRKL